VSADPGAALFEALHFFAIDHFLTAGECALMREVMRAAPADGATVARGGAGEYLVDEALRRTRRVEAGVETEREFVSRLDAIRDAAAQHFGVALSETEKPQFLLYREGDFFTRHADRDRAGANRRAVSIIVFLNDDYAGGKLTFFGDDLGIEIAPEEGQLIGFRSETPHEVSAVTSGERFTVVSWFL
jgi:SM-20-related protein